MPDEQTTLGRGVNRLVYVALLVLAVAIAFFLKWSYQSEKVLEVKNSPFPSSIIKDDGHTVVILKVNYCKYSDAKGKVRTSFVSSTREVFLPLGDEDQKATCKETELPIVIPKDLPPDTYKIKFRTTYKLNPLRTAVNEFESSEFEVK